MLKTLEHMHQELNYGLKGLEGDYNGKKA